MFMPPKSPKKANALINETSPYLLQHAYNPVDWFPWGKEAFEKASREDKPIFLSVGYSTCHWCHVMEKESFESEEVAELLNSRFVAVKVDKEERPDVDGVYMKYCQAYTGSGGWPMTIIMSPEKIPFFAGTYFPKHSRRGLIGITELLKIIGDKWQSGDKSFLTNSGSLLTVSLRNESKEANNKSVPDFEYVNDAAEYFKQNFDFEYGGFGRAPKFPSPHNLMFLLDYYELNKDLSALNIAEKTLSQMYRGGIFDHIGYGFSRYSTDKYWLVPHFEKMLYDNALLLRCYVHAYEITEKAFYKNVAKKIIRYVLREMLDAEGGFYSAQDADIDGDEGKYYLLSEKEITAVLGEKNAQLFNNHFNITSKGNFEGQNIPNLLFNPDYIQDNESINGLLPEIYEYRKKRYNLRKDDKILTAWNSLMIAALAYSAKVLREENLLIVCEMSDRFIQKKLSKGDKLFVSYRGGKAQTEGFNEDYAFYIYSQIQLYEATYQKKYLDTALKFCKAATEEFFDNQNGGYYLYGKSNEELILKPKETYDGATPSGNSVMAYNLLKLSRLTRDITLEEQTEKHFSFMTNSSKDFPAGYSFFMSALAMYLSPSKDIVCLIKEPEERKNLSVIRGFNTTVKVYDGETAEYKYKNNKTTYFICQNNTCNPPTNELI